MSMRSPRRRSTLRRSTTLADTIDRLPERFLAPALTGEQVATDLHAYTGDLDAWLRKDQNIMIHDPKGKVHPSPSVSDVLAALSIEPDQWFRKALGT